MEKTKEQQAIQEAASQLEEAAGAKKCWTCGCLHNSLTAIEKAFPEGERPKEIQNAIRVSRERLQEVRYDCLGCEVCYPALAINALNRISEDPSNTLEACPAEKAEEREGWPPLPGNYRVLRYRAPVAVCTLTSDGLSTAVAREAGPEISVVGALQTENLGLERLILNIVANPFIRFLVVCGADSQQAIGHLPGQSLIALSRYGYDERMRIIGAKGKRPVLRNISPEVVMHFRKTIEVIDLVGETKAEAVLEKTAACSGKDPGPSEPFSMKSAVIVVKGYLPERMVSDPAGYFVIYADRARKTISTEHYRNDGLLDAIVEGGTAAELYVPIIDKGLISRLDHAAYLGRELARAERALATGEAYVQDKAPEHASTDVLENCGCNETCREVP